MQAGAAALPHGRENRPAAAPRAREQKPMPSPWVREQARGRAATAGVRGGAVAAAVGAGELLPRPHRLTGVAQPQWNAFAAVFQLQMHAHACGVCGVPEVPRRLKN